MGYFVDVNDKIDKKKIVQHVNGNSNGIVFERPFFVDSGNDMPGIITVDILSYLKSWIALNPKPDDQLKLFPVAGEKKLQKIQEILSYPKFNLKRNA